MALQPQLEGELGVSVGGLDADGDQREPFPGMRDRPKPPRGLVAGLDRQNRGLTDRRAALSVLARINGAFTEPETELPARARTGSPGNATPTAHTFVLKSVCGYICGLFHAYFCS